MNSKLKYFPKYEQLNWKEKWFLNTCCYFPPKPRRIRGDDVSIDLERYLTLFKTAYGTVIFEDIKNKRILDFGCGEGGFSLALAANNPQSYVLGIDIVDGLKSAKKKQSDLQLNNLQFVIGRSNFLKDNSFDYVFSHDSFEHFEDPVYILNEMTRLVKPKGFILIKFGPTWASPYGRHMSGTIKKSWPWIHLLVSEKTIMRAHSVYHDRSNLYENYSDLVGGLNKMTVNKAMQIFNSFENLELKEKKIKYVWKGQLLKSIPYLNELFSGSLYVKLQKKN